MINMSERRTAAMLEVRNADSNEVLKDENGFPTKVCCAPKNGTTAIFVLVF